LAVGVRLIGRERSKCDDNADNNGASFESHGGRTDAKMTARAANCHGSSCDIAARNG